MRPLASVLAILLGSGGLLGAASSAGAAQPVCPGGRFAIEGEALLPGDLAGGDSLFLAHGEVTVASGCPLRAVKLRGTRRGTTLKATWLACDGAVGKVKLKARIDPACRTLAGTLTARKSKLKRTFTAERLPNARACDFVPGVSVPAVMPPEVLNPPPPPPPPPIVIPTPTPVPAATTAQQFAVFADLWNVVDDLYVDPLFGGVDWGVIGDDYEALVEEGLTDEDFALAMKAMVRELGDGHSHYESPQEVIEYAERLAAGQSFVGIGALAMPLSEDSPAASLILVFPGSPAEAAGLRAHDLLLAVDGLPFRDEFGVARTLGPAGTRLDLTFQRGDGAPQTIELTRAAVNGFYPVDRCIVPTTRIGYVMLPTFLDPTIADSVRAAIQDLSVEGPLEGLIVDDRMNGGGFGNVATEFLGLFLAGAQGRFVARDASAQPLALAGEDVMGSQTVPLVVLAERRTASYAEIAAGVLQRAGRATVIGAPTRGNVEQLSAFDFADGSRVWLAARTFEPVGLPPGAWEGVGIVPDLAVPTRWDLFTEATDPALAGAVEVLRSP